MPATRSILPFIGVIHLKPLPGAPRWQGSMATVIAAARADAVAYEKGGANSVIIENFGDVPFTRDRVPAETVAAMAVVGRAVRDAVRLPVGFNVLRNDPLSALALCAACEGAFIRVNVHAGAMLTDQGLIEGDAFTTLRRRKALGLEHVLILADVLVKHAVPPAAVALADTARDTLERGLADALIVSGVGTGHPTATEDVLEVRKACPDATILLGSGVNSTNIAGYQNYADGFIVGSSLKRNGRLDQPVDFRRVRQLAGLLNKGGRRK